MDEQSIVECWAVEKRFARTRALRGVDFALQKGELVLLEGANGAGKSTLLKCLAGIVRIDRGKVERQPACCWDSSASRLRCGLYLQHPMLYQHLTGYENLTFFANVLRCPNAVELVDAVIRKFSLGDFIYRKVEACSPGMQRKIAIARTFLLEAPVVLLDEPFASIDREGKAQIARAISELVQSGGSAVVVSHEVADLAPTRNIIMQSGQILRASNRAVS